jgi:hypothetical protein
MKTSAQRREQIRRSKHKNAGNYKTPQKIERAKKQKAASARRHRAEQNERRNARRARDRAAEARLNEGNELTSADMLQAGITICNQMETAFDNTRWIGPGMYKEIALEKQADEILRQEQETACPNQKSTN